MKKLFFFVLIILFCGVLSQENFAQQGYRGNAVIKTYNNVLKSQISSLVHDSLATKVTVDDSLAADIADILSGTSQFTKVNAANGSASAPSYTFGSSTGSGMYLNASNILAFTTAGADRVFVDAGGRLNVGAEQTSALFGVKNVTNQANLALFTNVNGTTRATLDSAGTFTPIKYGAAVLGGSVTASDSSTSVILKDSGGKKWKIKVNTQGVVSADSTGLN